MSERVYGNKVKIDYDNTLDFFEHRGDGKNLDNKYNYVLFQDDSPEIAIQRDKDEKVKIGNVLNWNKGERVLDIGCGIGRWGETILDKGLKYIGIDYSSKLLKIAKENLKEHHGNATLLQGSFQEFESVLTKANQEKSFDKIFVNGVMMYINDVDLNEGLERIEEAAGEHCELYFKESMAVNERLTLRDFYSDSLTQNYTAIYRSISEYKALFEKYFVDKGFTIKEEGSLYDEKLKNRKETLDYYFLLVR